MARSANTGTDTAVMDAEPIVEAVVNSIEGADSVGETSTGTAESVFLEIDGKRTTTTLDKIDIMKYSFVGLSGETKVYR